MAGLRFQQHHSLGMLRSDFQTQSPQCPSPSQRTRGCSCIPKNQPAPHQEKFAIGPGLLKVLFPFTAM